MREAGARKAGPIAEPDLPRNRIRFIEQGLFRQHRSPEAHAAAGARLHRQRKIVEHRQIVEYVRDLIRTRQTDRHTVMHRHAGYLFSVKKNPARVRYDGTGYLVYQCGLAGAVGTDQRVDFARMHRQVQMIGSGQSAEAFDQFTQFEHRLRHFASSRETSARRRRWNKLARPFGSSITTASKISPSPSCQWIV